MSSRFGWVDFAEDDRERMLRVVDLFREQGTQDELGIGTVRDAFADFFFPGTSTIQTRARYMLFVPWSYLDLEDRRVPSTEASIKGRRAEVRLIYALLEAGELRGVIGQESKDQLRRLPSAIYWAGLGSWGIRQFVGSQDQYHRYLDVYYRRTDGMVLTDEREPAGAGARCNWHRGLPEAPDGFPDEATMALTAKEAQYLQERVLMCHPDSLMAKLLLADRHFDCEFLWHHPLIHSLPDVLKTAVWHSQCFSQTIHGAALLYNLMMAQARGVREWIDGYQERLSTWVESVQDRWDDLASWQREIEVFWALPTLARAMIPYRTRVFVSQWLHFLFSVGPERVGMSEQARRLIADREEQLKHARARLSNARALQLWLGASGDRQLDFRWGTAATLLDDLHAGLGHGGDDAGAE